jgi:DNA-binding Lrp family transcriptional regulator
VSIIHRAGPPVNPGCAQRPSNSWTVRVSADFDLAAYPHSWTVTLIALERHARSKSSCWPSNETLATAVGLSPSQVRVILAGLEAAGLIRRERTPTGGRTIHLERRIADTPALSASSPSPPAGKPAPHLKKETEEPLTTDAVVVVSALDPEDPIHKAALEIARSKGQGRGYAVGVLRNWQREGLPEPAKPKPERTYHRAAPRPPLESLEPLADWRALAAEMG